MLKRYLDTCSLFWKPQNRGDTFIAFTMVQVKNGIGAEVVYSRIMEVVQNAEGFTAVVHTGEVMNTTVSGVRLVIITQWKNTESFTACLCNLEALSSIELQYAQGFIRNGLVDSMGCCSFLAALKIKSVLLGECFKLRCDLVRC